MSKFRKKKKSLSVNGKLPFLALFPALWATKKALSYSYQDKDEVTRALSKFMDGVYHKEEGRIFLSVINSKKNDASVVEHGNSLGLAISTAGILTLVEYLFDNRRNHSSNTAGRGDFIEHDYSTTIVKLLDIALGVSEMDFPVMECEITDASKWKSYFGGYSGIPVGDRGLGTSPYLSKRYEKHNIYEIAKNSFSSIKDSNDRVRWKHCLDSWKMDLEHYKDNNLPSAFVASEILLTKKELGL